MKLLPLYLVLAAGLFCGCQNIIDEPVAGRTSALLEIFSLTENSSCGSGDIPHDTADACVQCFNATSLSLLENPADIYEVTIKVGAHNRDNFDRLHITDQSGSTALSDYVAKAQEVDVENNIALYHFVLYEPIQTPILLGNTVFCVRADTAPLEPDNNGDTVQVEVYETPPIGNFTGIVALDSVTSDAVDAVLGIDDVLTCDERQMEEEEEE